MEEKQSPLQQQSQDNSETLQAQADQTSAAQGTHVPPAEEPKPTAMQSLYLLLHDMSYLLAALALLFVFVLRLMVVVGPSMNPTFYQGDYIFILSNAISREYRQGDIVVARVADFDEEPIVKRVIATAGQTVDIDFNKGIVYVDGQALEEPYIAEPTYRQFAGTAYPVTVPEGSVFLMGDNRNHSNDSRDPQIGTVDIRDISGRAIFLAFPSGPDGKPVFSRIGGIS